MGNRLTYRRRPDLEDCKMSNGLTSVFVAVLSLAASALARDDEERELAVWIASHDQNIFGSGVVGFDVGEMPWNRETFEAQRLFLLRAIDAAKAKTEWDKLGYEPSVDMVLDRLDRFQRMIAAFDCEHASPRGAGWHFERTARFERCPIHGIYLHSHGCVICNDR